MEKFDSHDEKNRSRDFFRSVIQQAPVGLAVTDMNRKVVSVNAAAEKLTGLGSDRIIGQDVSIFYSNGFSVDRGEIELIAAGGQVVRDTEFMRDDGTSVPVQIAYSYVPENDGEGPFIVEAYSDQTDRKQFDRLKNEFVFIAAHELRSPVTAINLLLNLIFEDTRLRIDPIMRDYLNKLHEAEERLLQLVDDLLEVSRTEVGRLKMESAPHDVGAAISSVFSDLRANALSRGVTLAYESKGTVPLVMADRNKLREVVVNLVSNSIKYNVPGGSVAVSHRVSDNRLFTTVKDTGIGIKESEKENLFRKFWRSEDLSVRSQPGTGLGLFIVRELVERMGGKVSLESEVGRGTSVTFSLPLAPPEASRGAILDE